MRRAGRVRLAGATVLLLAGLWPASAGAASFDCGKARTPDERAVCADPTLSTLDSEMGALWFSYSRFQLLMGASGARRDDARAFLAARAACGADAACLAPLYRQRNAALKQQIAAAITNLTRQANADPAPAGTPPMPQPVMDTVGAFFAQCRDLGGELQGNALPQAMSADLDRDGRPDYVLDAQNLRCDGAATAFCANDGCDVAVNLSSAGYAPLRLRGSRPTLVQGTEQASLDLWVDRSQCRDAAPGAACWGSWRWNGTALKPAYAVRAP
ncbi:lysozyme inhibitor LprI family protein [Ancylobacter oerskovii]|uniref:Lysozyme inhibitor LprI family protein n=1 Tax=Ancylobacter oerskovii TaxID=459519 RepID=A0ABW4Z4G8_9HYPH|nr:hypothetical protein [Ancylobacter oerskovii]MBS7546005.1 hypothetical protein [Ancylobacter oerskovii]